MSKSCDLETLCLKMNSSWQFIDLKLNGSLSSIATGQKIPKDTITVTYAQNPSMTDLACTIYTVVRDVLERKQNGQTNAKNFFDGYAERSLSFTEKENIYWKLRLRYACGIIPVAVARMDSELRQAGYTEWMLPNGINVPLNALLLISFHAVPNNVHVIKSVATVKGEIVSTINEMVEAIQPRPNKDFKNEPTVVQHTVLGVVLPSGERYVIDPTSLQFGIRGKANKLIYTGSWEEYCQVFPGEQITLTSEWKESKVEARILYQIGNQGFGHIDKLVKKALLNLTDNCCNHCGQTERCGGQDSQEIGLLTCSRCKIARYCDQLCQKANWKFHRNNGCVAQKK